MPTITTRIDDETQNHLQALADATERSRSWLVADAIRRYVEDEKWQIEAILEGVSEADNGNFATEEEVNTTFSRLGVKVEQP